MATALLAGLLLCASSRNAGAEDTPDASDASSPPDASSSLPEASTPKPPIPAAPPTAVPSATAGPAPQAPAPLAPEGSTVPRRDGQGAPELVWDRAYARFGIANYVATGALGATTLAMAIIPPIAGNRRSGGVAFDESVRSTLRASSQEGRYVARDVSDVFLSLSTTYPFFIDALVSAWWFRGSADVAREMALIDAEAFAITGALQGVTNVMVARERPYGRNCGGDLPSDSIDCTTTGRYRSFFSGHSAFTFTAAGLVCSHHLRLDLLGNKIADVTTCVAAYLGAGAAATLRVVGDMHYPTDILTGALVGTTVGLVVPWFHYKGFRTGMNVGGADLHFLPTGTGASVMGTF